MCSTNLYHKREITSMTMIPNIEEEGNGNFTESHALSFSSLFFVFALWTWICCMLMWGRIAYLLREAWDSLSSALFGDTRTVYNVEFQRAFGFLAICSLSPVYLWTVLFFALFIIFDFFLLTLHIDIFFLSLELKENNKKKVHSRLFHRSFIAFRLVIGRTVESQHVNSVAVAVKMLN